MDVPAVEPLRPEDLPALRALFRSFPYKSLQQRTQRLDPEKLADLYLATEKNRLEKEPEPGAGQWILREGGAPVGYAALQPDEWHSPFYGRPFGRIAPFLSHAASPDGRNLLARTLCGQADRAGIRHLVARIDGSEYQALRALEAMDFYLVDCSVKMSGDFADLPQAAPPRNADRLRIRPYRPEDLGALRRIVATSHPFNHYYNDHALPPADTNRLFAAWVERCCTLLRATVFLLERDAQPCGFIVYLVPRSLNQVMATKLVILDFVCLDGTVRGGGVGRWLIRETLQSLAWEYDTVELRTSQNNYPALQCYAALGLRIVSTDFVVHRSR